MSTAVLDKVRTERDQARAAALAIAEGDNFNPDDDNFKELEARAEALDARAATLADLIEKQAAADALDGRLSKSLQAREERRETTTRPQTRQSWGESFVRSEEFSEYRGRGSTGIFNVEELETRALPTSVADLIAAGMTPATHQVDVTAPVAPTPILDNVTTVNVSVNAIEYVAWTQVSGGAAIVPEEGAKPATEYGPTVTSDTLDTIAHYTQLTRQLIEDLPAVRSLIDGELRRGVLIKEEAEAAAAIIAATLPTASSTDSLLAAIRVGIATVQGAGYAANAVMLNPADWAELDLQVMEGTNNGPVRSQSFWGLTPIASPDQTAGTATVGDFRTGVQHFVRSQVALYITDSHADTFTKNIFTMLAERRSLTAVVRPDAMCECTGPAPV